MKKLSSLKGAKALNKQEQKEIIGGKPPLGGCETGYSWNPMQHCCWSDVNNCCYGYPDCPAPYARG